VSVPRANQLWRIADLINYVEDNLGLGVTGYEAFPGGKGSDLIVDLRLTVPPNENRTRERGSPAFEDCDFETLRQLSR
jgi:hypothetical protein